MASVLKGYEKANKFGLDLIVDAPLHKENSLQGLKSKVSNEAQLRLLSSAVDVH